MNWILTILIGTIFLVVLYIILRYLEKRAMGDQNKLITEIQDGEEKTKVTPAIIIKQKLPKWVIQERKPMLLSPTERKKYVQVVLLSRRPPYHQFMWAKLETDEPLLSVGDYAFPIPKEIHESTVFWDIDNDKPLLQGNLDNDIKTIKIDPETGKVNALEEYPSIEKSLLKNFYFMLGKLEGAKQLFSQFNLVLIFQIITIIALVALAYLFYNQAKELNAAIEMVKQALSSGQLTVTKT